MNGELTASIARSVLQYDDATGRLIWKDRTDIPQRVNKRLVGKVAGVVCRKRGYVVLGINRKCYLAHRVVWLIVTGDWPAGNIDHEDTNKSNNRFSNLRPANQSQNMGNRGKQKNNTSGFKGVYYDKANDKWAATIMVNKRGIGLGRFATREEAATAYDEAAKKFFGEFARTNFAA